jgi:hypothetical protein
MAVWFARSTAFNWSSTICLICCSIVVDFLADFEIDFVCSKQLVELFVADFF